MIKIGSVEKIKININNDKDERDPSSDLSSFIYLNSDQFVFFPQLHIYILIEFYRIYKYLSVSWSQKKGKKFKWITQFTNMMSNIEREIPLANK